MSDIERRKEDHILLAQRHQGGTRSLTDCFYEPLFGTHPLEVKMGQVMLGNFSLNFPLWISSMTGGAERGEIINKRLATTCAKFGLGMGLGSCRILLDSDKSFNDFNVRPILGPDRPLMTNFGVAQIEEELHKAKGERVFELTERLQANGIIIHVNPLQEWFQAGGDRFERPAIETLREFVELSQFPVIVKEVGHGFGPKSLLALLKMPLLAVELAGLGGTNFSSLEIERSGADTNPLAYVGHSAEEMIGFLKMFKNLKELACQNVIISGGVKDFLQAYRLLKKCPLNSLIGMANNLLGRALEGQDVLDAYVEEYILNFQMAENFITTQESEQPSDNSKRVFQTL